MRQITTSTLSNQNISSALLTATYTADADRDIFFRLFADQVAGNGTYSAYITIQRLGAGAAYEVQPRTSPSVASGITSIAFTTVPIPVKNTDVVKVYIVGLAGDTTTPDIITEVWEADYARPITAGQYSTNIDSSGRVLLQPTQTGVTIPTVTDVTTKTGYGLVDGAITAAKIATDAIDADALAADAVAKIAAAITAGATAAEVWAYAVRTLTSRANQSDEDTDPEIIRLTRGDSYSKSWTDLGAVTGYTKLWHTSKGYEAPAEDQPDSDALTMTVLGSGFATTGLIWLNGETATASQASLTVDDAATGDITWAIDEVATAQLAPGRYRFDIQVLVGTTITTLLKGILIVEADYTRATS